MSEPIKILYLDHAPFWGGAENILESHLRSLDRERFLPCVGIATGQSEFGDRFQLAGAEVLELPMEKLKTFNPQGLLNLAQSCAAIKKVIKEQQIDLVFTNTSRSFYTGVLAARWAGIPLIAWVHDFLYVKSLLRSAAPFVAHFIWSSEAVRQFYGLPSSAKSRVLYPENRFVEKLDEISSATVDDLRRSWGAEATTAVIGYVGRLVEDKGVQVLIPAFSELRQKLGETARPKLVIVGSGAGQRGDNEAELRQLVDDLGLVGDVIFAGFTTQTALFYKAFDIFVMPSIAVECFPTTVVEAMLSGLPVVASHLGGVVEQIANEQSGFLFEPGDVSGLTNRLERLYREGDLRRRLGEAGRIRAAEVLSGPGTNQKIADLLTDVVNGPKPKSR